MKGTLCLVFLCAGAFAQTIPLENYEQKELFTIGGGINLGYNAAHSNFFFNLPTSSACGTFTTGSAMKPNFEAFGTMPLLKDFDVSSSLRFQNLSSTLEASPSDTAYVYYNGAITPAMRIHKRENSVSVLALNFSAQWHSPLGVLVSLGPTISFPISNSFTHTETITSPQAFYKETGSPTRTLDQGKITSLASVLIGTSLSLSYPLQLKKDITLFPTASIIVPFSELSSDEHMSVTTYAFGANLGWTIRQAPEPLPLPPPPLSPPPPAPRVFALDAELAVYGLSETNERMSIPPITIEKKVIKEEFNLLTKVFFDEGASTITSRYHLLTSRDETNKFSGAGLATRDALEISHEILNIIGERIRHESWTKIKLTGATSASGSEATNTLDLARARAESVKKYLVDAWKIEPWRIAVEARKLPEFISPVNTTEGQEENRRVDISSADYTIVRPLDLSSVEYIVNPPQLGIAPVISSDTSILSCEVQIATRSKTLLTFTADASNSQPKIEPWRMTPEQLDENEDSLTVILTVTDATGQKIEKRSFIPIVRANTMTSRNLTQQINDEQIERYSLITFDFDKGTLPTEELRKLETAVSTLTPESKVVVTGYTDLTGDAIRNMKLSRARAENVAKFLESEARARGITPQSILVNAKGATELYNNTLAEGRFLSRTVKIEIVKPLK